MPTLAKIREIADFYGHPVSRPQDDYPAVLRAARLRNNWQKFPISPIPNLMEAISWSPPLSILNFKPIGYFRNPKIPMIYVNEPAQLLSMIAYLNKQKVVAFDLEFA